MLDQHALQLVEAVILPAPACLRCQAFAIDLPVRFILLRPRPPEPLAPAPIVDPGTVLARVDALPAQ